MNQRDYSYDFLRSFAAIMIVFCHVFHGFGFRGGIGYYLGGTFVDVFLLLSAYLLGKSSNKKISAEPWKFLVRRSSRIIPTYYTFLTLTFLIIVVLLGFSSLSLKQIVGHYLFLNYFIPSTRVLNTPLPQLGHLWFMSCIIFSYLFVTGYSIIIRRIRFLNSTRGWFFFFIIIGIIATVVTMKNKFMVYPFTSILGFTILFFKGDNIISWIRKIPATLLVILLIVGNLIGLLHYSLGGKAIPSLSFWINMFNACMWITCAPFIFNCTKIPRAVLFISTISFEIYLIHHPFCLGAYSLAQYMPKWLATMLVFTFAIIGGWILSELTSLITKTRFKKPEKV